MKNTISKLSFLKFNFRAPISFQHGFGNVTRSLLLSLFFFLGFSTAFAQFNLPSEKRCTSKDLELVEARLTGGDACNSCTTGATVTRTLTLSINNTTGSNRTSFAFWGTLERYNGNTLVSSAPINGCNSTPLPGNTSAVPPNTITDLDFNQITYTCGQRLIITNLFLAWTSAADNASCPLESSKIAPKCGTLPFIEINAGVNGTVTSVAATCTAGGSITVAPFGGTPPYSVKLGNGAPSAVAAGASKTFTGVAAGDYNVTITDSALPAACSIIKPITVGGPTPIGAPAATVVQPTCTTATGTVNVTSPTAGITYTLRQGGVVIYTAASGVFSSVAPGTYQFFASIGICSTPGSDKIVNPQPGTPAAPSLKITEPSLCGPSTGSIEVCNPINGYTYTRVGGASIVASGSSVIFSNLAAGSNPSVTARNGAGCTSAPANCSSATKDCPAAGLAGTQTGKISSEKTTIDKTEKVGFVVYPVPFKDQLNVRYGFDYASQVLIEVFNAQGVRVLSKKDTDSYLDKEVSLNLNHNTGKNEVYFVKVTTDRGTSMQKVISSR
jgi:hypothetical protein